MADKIVVKAEKREETGKNVNRRLRAAGKVPVVVYGGGGESVSATADLKDLAAILRTESGPNTLFAFEIEGVGSDDVIFQDRQIDPIKGRLVHADLRRFSKGEKIEVTVSIHLVGEPVGVKEDGSMLEQSLREVKVLCEPANIPDFIEVDVSELKTGEMVHVSDLKVASNVEVQDDPEALVAAVHTVKEPELESAVEEGEPGVAGEESETAAEEGGAEGEE
jgi:large subunit ribosomal protein L25